MDDLEKRLLDTIARTFRVPRQGVTTESTKDTIASWDSLQHVHLILALEEEFAVQFEVDEIAVMESVSIILAVLRERVGSAS